MISEDLVFETITEAQTSVDPVKLGRAVEKFAKETEREIALGFGRGSYATFAPCALHTTRTA